MKKYVSLAILVGALAGAGAVPGFADDTLSQRQPSPAYVPDNPRDAAIHDCSVQADKWSFSSWQSTQIITYGDCMTEHGQPQ
jgi:hypothetical protein